jgi:Flp pilus assembly pilin Flp
VGRKILAWWHAATADERGASLVEYAFLIVLIALIAFAAVEFFGQTVNSEFSDFTSGYEQGRGNAASHGMPGT